MTRSCPLQDQIRAFVLCSIYAGSSLILFTWTTCSVISDTYTVSNVLPRPKSSLSSYIRYNQDDYGIQLEVLIVVTLKYGHSLKLIPLDLSDNRHRSQKQKPLTHWLPSGHLICAPQCFGSNNREMDWPWIPKCAEDVSVKLSPKITNVFPIVSNVNWMKEVIIGQSILWFK